MPTLEINTFTELTDWSLLTVAGPDATEFLQNQLTNSVQKIAISPIGKVAKVHDQHIFAGYCSAKGRLMASFWVSKWQTIEKDNLPALEYQLLISKDLAALISKRLAMFILRSKVNIIDQTTFISLFGFTYEKSNASEVLISEINTIPSVKAVELPAVMHDGQLVHRLVISVPQEMKAQLQCVIEQGRISSNSKTWEYLEITSALPRITQATYEKFVPQMINMESLKGVDFQKGCYPGQEVVARSQYRGTIKRRLHIATIENSIMPTIGQELFSEADPDQPCGMVVLCASDITNANLIQLQVECKLEALELGHIHLGSPTGPILHFHTLPYPLVEI